MADESLDRRGVLQAGFGAGAVLALSASDAYGASVIHSRWDDTADIVVVGFGVAGAATAIEAYDADPSADILIIDKEREAFAGGCSRASGFTLFLPRDLEAVIAYQRALNAPNAISESLLREFCEARVALEPWLADLAKTAGFEYVRDVSGGPAPEYPGFPGAASVASLGTVRPSPHGVWRTFKTHVDRRPIRVKYETSAADLVQDPGSGEISGVVAKRGGRSYAIRARRAVVLCCGGYENNPAMHRDYGGYDRVYSLGAPANTGDGLRMLQRAGADMWHMRNPNQTGGLIPSIKAPGFDAVFFRDIAFRGKSWLDVAADDRRFMPEGKPPVWNHFRYLSHGRWMDSPLSSSLPVHMIFDETCRRAGALASKAAGWNAAMGLHAWSMDNSVEIERGWVARAATIGDLARRIGRDPQALQATVERFNAACDVGVDQDFGRTPTTMSPILKPPFYAVEIVPGVPSTTGGARRDAKARVLDTSGRPIPRLYEAGQLGSLQANLYQGGTFLTEAMVFGRAAGANAVRERPA